MTIQTFDAFYSVDLCRLNPNHVFVFGDNTLGFGKAGQAAIRDEPNAFGVATKVRPDNAPGAFFVDDLYSETLMLIATEQLTEKLRLGATLVIPVLPNGMISLGCGLARLPETAPNAYGQLQSWLAAQTTTPFDGVLS